MNISIPIPDFKEQTLIFNKVNNLIENNFETISPIQSSIQKLKEYRQSIISEAVTGKIDVRDWQAPKS